MRHGSKSCSSDRDGQQLLTADLATEEEIDVKSRLLREDLYAAGKRAETALIREQKPSRTKA